MAAEVEQSISLLVLDFKEKYIGKVLKWKLNAKTTVGRLEIISMAPLVGLGQSISLVKWTCPCDNLMKKITTTRKTNVDNPITPKMEAFY